MSQHVPRTQPFLAASEPAWTKPPELGGPRRPGQFSEVEQRTAREAERMAKERSNRDALDRSIAADEEAAQRESLARTGLTPTEVAAARLAGVSPEAFAATKAAEKDARAAAQLGARAPTSDPFYPGLTRVEALAARQAGVSEERFLELKRLQETRDAGFEPPTHTSKPSR
jgi:hypothetical protein